MDPSRREVLSLIAGYLAASAIPVNAAARPQEDEVYMTVTACPPYLLRVAVGPPGAPYADRMIDAKVIELMFGLDYRVTYWDGRVERFGQDQAFVVQAQTILPEHTWISYVNHWPAPVTAEQVT